MLGLDTMVMDNDEAKERQGVKPTYKKVDGFQPLQMTWGRSMLMPFSAAGISIPITPAMLRKWCGVS